MPPWPLVPAWRSSVARPQLQEPSVVEPIDPFKGGELDSLEVSPWSAPVDHLGLVETVDGFGESIVVGISDTAERLYACFSQALVLRDAVGWQITNAGRTLLASIEMRVPRRPKANKYRQ